MATPKPVPPVSRPASGADHSAPDPHPNDWYRAFNPPFQVLEQPLHSRRRLRLLVVGAGAAGLLVAYQARRQLRGVTVAVYEKNSDVGGTWFENRYPGIEIDSPSHSYQWSFRPNPNWSRYMSPGREVWQYLKDWAEESGVMGDVNLGHQIESAVWREDEGVWVIKGRRTADGTEFEDRGEILFGCNGPLNNPKFPDVPGIESFRGQLVHSGRWPDNLDLRGKTVAVIGGSGASGVQIVPAIQPVVGKLIVYLRSRFWAVPGVRSRLVGPGKKNFSYDDELRRAFKESPDLLEQYNRDVEADAAWFYEAFHIKSPLGAKVADALRAGTVASFGPDKAARFLPDYGFGCRRSAPVQDFATRLQRPNVEVVQAAVVGFTETGIIDSDGGTRDVDVCVCATSFHAAVPTFDIVGRGGRNLRREISDNPKSYLSLMNAGYPNLFYISSHNGPVNHGSYLPMLEWYVRYAFKVVSHVQRTSIASFVPSEAAQEDYFVWSHQLMKRLTVSQPCHSWFKAGGEAHGPATAVYAGSRAHFYEALKEPRWEDFEMRYQGRAEEGAGSGGNRFAYLGNGFTFAETTPGADPVWYLDLLKREQRQGKEAFDINPPRPRRPPADPSIVIPKANDEREAKL